MFSGIFGRGVRAFPGDLTHHPARRVDLLASTRSIWGGEDEGDIAATHPNQSPGHPHVPLLELPMLGFKTRLQFYDKSQLFQETKRFLRFIL